MSYKIYARLFAENGFKVFPLINSKDGPIKPYGWTGKKVKAGKEHLAIAATSDVSEVEGWDEIVEKKYKSTVSGYGVLGTGCVIIDVDIKDDKGGLDSFNEMFDTFDFPKCKLVVKSKSGGYHFYYDRPKGFGNRHVKSLSNIKINEIIYGGVDLRGDGGFVVGPTQAGEWEEGVYTMIRGNPAEKLSTIPSPFIESVTKSTTMYNDLESITVVKEDEEDYRTKLKNGELPDTVPIGGRNEGFYLFINALKSKGISRSAAKALANQLAARCEGDDLGESVDIDDMITRVFEVDSDNPYDIAADIINRGFYQIINYKNKPFYCLPHENPYLTTRRPHDSATMKELMAKYARIVVTGNGKEKLINPMDVILPRIPDEHKVDSIGFKPGAGEVFSIGSDYRATTFMNIYNAPEDDVAKEDFDQEICDDFIKLVTRIFGEPGTENHTLGLDFLSWLLQKPGQKMSIAPLLLSRVRGVGKSLYFNLVHQIMGVNRFGDGQAKMVKLDEVTGRFFDPTSCLVNLMDEVQFGIHKNVRQEFNTFWRHLKNLVTAEVIPVELKGGATMQMPNTAALIMAGNTDGFIPMEEMDRRVWVIDTHAPQLEVGYVDRLFDIIKSTNSCKSSYERLRLIKSLRHFLAAREIQMDLSTIRAPMTEVKQEMVRQGLTDQEDWLINYFEQGINLLGVEPILSHSSLLYILRMGDKILHEKWRDDAELIIRDLKRKGIISPIRRKGAMRKMVNVPVVLPNGEVAMPNSEEILFHINMIRNLDEESDDDIRKMFYRNLQTLKHKRSSSNDAESLVG